MKRPLIIANWKMHKTLSQASSFIRRLDARMKRRSGLVKRVEAAVAPSHPLLAEVRRALTACRNFRPVLAAQDVHPAEWGAFTGAVSPLQLKASGVRYVIVGHSERRNLFGETDYQAALKVRAVLRHGMIPVLCVGEALDQRKAGNAERFVRGQLQAVFFDGSLPAIRPLDLVIAYEPVWAIGTGKAATAADARQMHAVIGAWCQQRTGCRPRRILYGGSVTPGNAAELLAQPGVEGLLVGGASLDAASFAAILSAGAPAPR